MGKNSLTFSHAFAQQNKIQNHFVKNSVTHSSKKNHSNYTGHKKTHPRTRIILGCRQLSRSLRKNQINFGRVSVCKQIVFALLQTFLVISGKTLLTMYGV